MVHPYFNHREIGKTERYNHEECGDKRQRLYVTREARGWKYHCHNCAPKFSGFFYDKELPSYADTLQLLSMVKEPPITTVTKEVQLPSDMSYDIPDIALAWMYKYGIRDDEIQLHGIGWSNSLRRLILPVVDVESGQLIYWQGRGFNPSQPKYMNVKQQGTQPLFICGSGSPTVFVEDILSAIKVGRVTKAIALLGSYFHKGAKQYVMDGGYIWLDSDKRGDCIRMCSNLSTVQAKQIRGIYTDQDPKCYDEGEIRKLILDKVLIN